MTNKQSNYSSFVVRIWQTPGLSATSHEPAVSASYPLTTYDRQDIASGSNRCEAHLSIEILNIISGQHIAIQSLDELLAFFSSVTEEISQNPNPKINQNSKEVR